MRLLPQTYLPKKEDNMKITPQQGNKLSPLSALDINKQRAREQLLAMQVLLANTPKKY